MIYNNFIVYVDIYVQHPPGTGEKHSEKLIWHLVAASESHEKNAKFPCIDVQSQELYKIDSFSFKN